MGKLYCIWDLNKLKEYAKPPNYNTVSQNESKLSIQYTQAVLLYITLKDFQQDASMNQSMWLGGCDGRRIRTLHRSDHLVLVF